MEPRADRLPEFESLRAFFEIVRNERYFKIQIITLESLETFEAALESGGVGYTRRFSSAVGEAECAILILKDSEVDVRGAGRYILFCNKRHKDFVQIVFSPTKEEKIAIVGDKYVVEAYGYKNVSELMKIANKEEFEMSEYFGSGMDYFESVLMLVVWKRSRFQDILSGAREVDDRLGNGFFLQMKLNGLVGKLLVVRNGDNYKVNVSEDVLRRIGSRVGFDAKMGA